MGRKITGILLFTCLLGSFVKAQKDSARAYPYRGLLRAASSFAVGTMFSYSLTNLYLTGNMEYYTDNKISVRGDGYYFFNSAKNNNFLKQNHQLYFGACYNFSLGNYFNPFIGLQPGMAIVKTDIPGDPVTFSPLASIVTGFNMYAEKWFHFMINVRYTIGQQLNEVAQFNINEISFSFGLGWDLDISGKKY